MNKLFPTLVVICFTLLFLISCGAKVSEEKDSKIISNIDSKADTSQSLIENKNEIKKLSENHNLKVRLFFNYFRTNEKPFEIKDFNRKKKYNYCYDVEQFDKLILEGNVENISIIVKSGTYIHLKQENIEIHGEKVYTPSDFDISDGTIIISQNNNVIFEGAITSSGCL